MKKITFTIALALALAWNAALYGQGYFAEPYCGAKSWEKYAPKEVASTNAIKINQPIGQRQADALAIAFGLKKSKCFTPVQFYTFITGGGYGGNLTNAKMITDATLILTNTKENPLARTINGVPVSIILGSYGLTVDEDGNLESCAQSTSPCRLVNELFVPITGYLATWCRANGAEEALLTLYRSVYFLEAVYSLPSQNDAGAAQLVMYNKQPSTSSVQIGMSMIPPLWIVNFCLIYTMSPQIAAYMPAYWTAIPWPVASAIKASPTGQVPYSQYESYFNTNGPN